MSSPPLRIAHLIPVVGRTGSEAHISVLFPGLRAIGVESLLICPGPGPLTEHLSALGYEIRYVAPRQRAGLLGLGRTAAALKDVDLLHAHGPRAQWWSALLRKSGAARRAVATLHELGRSGAGSRNPRHWFDGIESWTLRSHDRVIAVSSFMRERAIAEAGIAPDRIDVVLNSCPLLLEPARPRTAPAEPRVAYTAARLQPEKGLDILIEAVGLLAAEGKTLHVQIAGEGADRPQLEALARARGVADQIDLVGWVSDSPERMRRAWFYINSSRDEPCSVAIVEAMALGIPIVATAAGGNPELLAGTAVPVLPLPGDAPGLARALGAMMDSTADAREALSADLQRNAYARFAPGPMAAATLSVYRSALGGPHGGGSGVGSSG